MDEVGNNLPRVHEVYDYNSSVRQSTNSDVMLTSQVDSE